MQALRERGSTPQVVTAASHPHALTTSTLGGDATLTAHRAIGRHDNMDIVVNNEVGDDVTISEVAKLNKVLFPNDAFPIPPQAAFKMMNKKSAWHKDGQWLQDPPDWFEAGSEANTAGFIQRLCDCYRELLKAKGIEVNTEGREWSAAYCDKPLPGGFILRKPDIVSVKSTRDGPTWEDVVSDVQLKSSPEELKAVTKQLRDGGLNVLTAQDDRLHHIGVGIPGDGIFTLLQDRSGCLRSKVIDINKDPVEFLRIILGLTFLDRTYLGYDPNITTRDGKRFLKMGRAHFEILQRLIGKDAGTRGLGTVRWRCRRLNGKRKGQLEIVKTCWIDRSRENTEDVYLERVKEEEIPGVPTLVEFEYVTTGNDVRVSTATIREQALSRPQLKKYDFEVRDLTRLVQEEEGVPLSCFETLPELLFGLSDSVKAHKTVCEKAHILHANINENSVLLNNASKPGTREGLLQDFNNAHFIQEGPDAEERQAATGLKSCDPAYASCEILMSGKYLKHQPFHDLESFFSLLLCLCILYGGPNGEHRQGFDPMKTPVGGWLRPDMQQAGTNKWGVLSLKRPSADTFGNFMDETIHPYFNPVKPCICELRSLVMDQTREATHEEFIEILRRHAEEIRDKQSRQTDSSNDRAPGDQGARDASETRVIPHPATETDGEMELAEAEIEESEALAVDGHAVDGASPEGSAQEDQSVIQPGSEQPDKQGPVTDITTNTTAHENQPTAQPDSAHSNSQPPVAHATTTNAEGTRLPCPCGEFATKNTITCKSSQCPIIYYHRGCAKRGSRPRGSAKNWHCDICRKRKQESRLANEPANVPADGSDNVPSYDPTHDPANDPANGPDNDPNNDANNDLNNDPTTTSTATPMTKS
ncbi:hypothetical protein K523DRAFT_298085 [Schizophyllum commune Tattone D]|nr:hypothetical protein K523DRAFT_298085 [Schizophyllum commune Tattone D]